MTKDEALKLALEGAANYIDALGGDSRKYRQALAALAVQEPVAWKLVPINPTEEMLKAMDECSKEGYDERLYAGHAASVYMAAVDAAPTQPLRHEHAEQLAKLGWQYFECPACGFEGAKAFPKPAQQEPVTLEAVYEVIIHWDEGGGKRSRRELARRIVAFYTSPPAQQEPVATLDDLEQEIYENTRQFVSRDVMEWMLKRYYTSPPAQQKPLTDEKIEEIAAITLFPIEFARAIETKLKEKNT